MPRRRTLPRRSAIEWGVRAVLAVLAAVLGYASLMPTLGLLVRDGDPERAHALASGDGRITALLARSLSGPEATPADRDRASVLARDALRHDPTAVVAVSTLGVNTQVRGDQQAAAALFAYAEKLSRRDLPTQLWAVENAVAHGEVGEALRHYDIALRTNRNAPNLLFPVLGPAIAEPAVREALVKVLASQPAWGTSFIQYVTTNGPDPQATANLFRAFARAGIAVSGDAQASVVTTLLAQDRVDDAWSYYGSLHPAADRRRSRDPLFVARSANPTPFDWTAVSDGGISTSIQQAEKGGVVDFSAPAGVGGPLLRQVQLLPPGRYRLEGHGTGIDQPDASRPYWSLTCRNGPEIARIGLPNSTEAGGVFAGDMTVPPGCPVQTLVLVAQPSDATGGLSGQIDRVLLRPAQ